MWELYQRKMFSHKLGLPLWEAEPYDYRYQVNCGSFIVRLPGTCGIFRNICDYEGMSTSVLPSFSGSKPETIEYNPPRPLKVISDTKDISQGSDIIKSEGEEEKPRCVVT